MTNDGYNQEAVGKEALFTVCRTQGHNPLEGCPLQATLKQTELEHGTVQREVIVVSSIIPSD